MKLNLGCGRRPLAGFINADLRAGEGVDRVFDAEDTWPFPTGSLDEVRADAIFEHLLSWEAALLEAARVLRPGGHLRIFVPYGWRGVAHPFHVRSFLPHTFDLFTDSYGWVGMDLRRHEGDRGSCEVEERAYFTKLEVEVKHYYPFAWHLAKRFGEWVYRLPLSRPEALQFLLRRNERKWSEEAVE